MSPGDDFASIDADALEAARADAARVRTHIDTVLLPYRSQFVTLGVSTGPLDRLAEVSRSLGEDVLPEFASRRDLAREAANQGPSALRAAATGPLPDSGAADGGAAPPSPGYSLETGPDGGTELVWDDVPTSAPGTDPDEAPSFCVADVTAGGLPTAGAEPANFGGDLDPNDDYVEVPPPPEEDDGGGGVGGWLKDRWDDTTEWIGDRWEDITGWWESFTEDLGAWIDENLEGLRDWIAEHAGILRVLATILKVVGWIMVVVGVILAIVGAAFFGIGAAPGIAVALAGLTVVGAGDFVDTAVDWGERKIDGQELVQQGALNLLITGLSFVGVGVVARIGQQVIKRLPASWVNRLQELAERIMRGNRRTPGDPRLYGPLRSDAPSGPGWRRRRDDPTDPEYGNRRNPHGTLAPDYRPRSYDELDPEMQELMGNDPYAQYGRNPDGSPMTPAEFDERYMGPDNRPRYPPNNGAVPGSRVQYHDLDEFTDVYGNQMDRIGGEGGSYMGVPPGTSFEQRSLPPGAVNDPIHRYEFTGELPPGYQIEVSEIAPAFGREGGGVQVQVMDPSGNPLSVEEMLDPELGILR